MEEIEVTIVNWDKYQSKTEHIRHPHWFKIRNDLPGSITMLSLTAAQKWAWVCLLCVASKKGKQFTVGVSQFSQWCGISENELLDLVRKLKTDGAIQTNAHTSAHTSAHSSEIRSDQSRIEKKRIYMSADADARVLLEVWKKYSPPLPTVQSLSPKRKALAVSRLRENPEQKYWEDVISRIAKSDFCLGAGNRGWRANFDWLLRPDTHLRVMEGHFDNKAKSKKEFIPVFPEVKANA